MSAATARYTAGTTHNLSIFNGRICPIRRILSATTTTMMPIVIA
jgi:hypothetical protein